jgi:hypothetical protein
LDDARNTVLNWSKHVIGDTIVETVVEIRESSSWHQLDSRAEQFVRSLFAERAALSLKCHSRF